MCVVRYPSSHLSYPVTLTDTDLRVRPRSRRESLQMSQKEGANLVVVVSEAEVGTGELGLNDFPEPVHW